MFLSNDFLSSGVVFDVLHVPETSHLSPATFSIYALKFTWNTMPSVHADSWSSLLETWKERFGRVLATASSRWSSLKPNCQAFVWFCWKISFWGKFQGNVTPNASGEGLTCLWGTVKVVEILKLIWQGLVHAVTLTSFILGKNIKTSM